MIYIMECIGTNILIWIALAYVWNKLAELTLIHAPLQNSDNFMVESHSPDKD